MKLQTLLAASLMSIAALGLSACSDEGEEQATSVGSGDGPTDGAGSSNPALVQGDGEEAGVIKPDAQDVN
ncbi:MAG: hypothetical protein KAG89_08015 [Fulvimarina manganoxydans]|uniref:hypothetical protein n=1 Tax=Fulvimarina manganoxydans TaxID=937218 RepID=UPI002354F2C9|nr:hypothetical protein [Fulvimarina manganoxydans]MCK5932105.1 hypothetical protein [Fulvimarina manganoxydans]